ncbi:UNVERIFIED_CONTAM: hypothetical protein Scaly_1059600 [Sesamum calycinum]|uniref:Uncharacterized protein n=1 Tax=Sesamum calycinum TaxID=2727403 RepID=A0AAW2QKM1_9LAMI
MLPKKDQQKANQKLATQGTPQINLAKKDDEIIAAVVVEANLVENKEDWILDTVLEGFCAANWVTDNDETAIGIAMNYAYNGKMRHIRIRHGAVTELLNNEIISLDYMRSERNLADPLTKGLTRRIIFES